MLPPVRLSVTLVDQSKTVEDIGSYNVYHNPNLKPSCFCDISLIQKEILTGSPEPRRQTMVCGKTSYFLALCVDISKTVRDTTKVTTDD